MHKEQAHAHNHHKRATSQPQMTRKLKRAPVQLCAVTIEERKIHIGQREARDVLLNNFVMLIPRLKPAVHQYLGVQYEFELHCPAPAPTRISTQNDE